MLETKLVIVKLVADVVCYKRFISIKFKILERREHRLI